MKNDFGNSLKMEINALIIGGIPLSQGQYLPSGEAKPTQSCPDGGYAFYDGKVLTLHDYEYHGCGYLTSGCSIGISVPVGELRLCMEGESSISVDAVSCGVGLYVPRDAHIEIRGKGSLTFTVRNGREGNFGICGEGIAEIKSGTLRVSAGLAEYIEKDGKKQYLGDSYAVYIREFKEHHARIRGNDKSGNCVNQNNDQQVIYDFPKAILWIPILLALVTAVCIAVTIWAVFFRSKVVLTPDFAPVEQERNAESIPDETDTDKLDHPEGGGALALTYSLEVSIDRASNRATLYVANPSRSNEDIVLQLVVQDEIIAQSGTISPGKQVKELDLLSGMADALSPGGYEGVIRVLSYKPDTGEATILNTDIAVTITVM